MNYSGFKLDAPEMIRLTPRKGYAECHLREVINKSAYVTDMRGRVIGACLTIETRLNGIISDNFTTRRKRDLFIELILEKEFFTLMTKWKIFRDLMPKINSKFLEKDRKELLKLFKDIIETRNRFAHGNIVFTHPLKLRDLPLPKLIYLLNGEKKEIILDEAYFIDLEKKFIKSLDLFDEFTDFKYLHRT